MVRFLKSLVSLKKETAVFRYLNSVSDVSLVIKCLLSAIDRHSKLPVFFSAHFPLADVKI